MPVLLLGDVDPAFVGSGVARYAEIDVFAAFGACGKLVEYPVESLGVETVVLEIQA